MERLTKWFPDFEKAKLLYRASTDGWSAKEFHSRCDNKGATLVLMQTDAAFVCGGYASVPWTSAPFPGKDVEDEKAFVFSLEGEEMNKYEPRNPKKALHHAFYAGPQFQWALALVADPMNMPYQGRCFT